MEQFVAEIRIFPFGFAPKGWALCNGQLLPLSQNTALFSLLGTVYGGDGKSTFALPDLQGSAPMGVGVCSTGGHEAYLGEMSGIESVTLLPSEMPGHTHSLRASSVDADEQGGVKNPSQAAPGKTRSTATLYGALSSNTGAMATQTLAPAGGSIPHNNMQPYLTLNFCIALEGIFPSRP